MPITRRRRANPPDQPENNNTNHVADQPETMVTPSAETPTSEQTGDASSPVEAENATAASSTPVVPASPASPASPVTPLPASLRGESLPYQPAFSTTSPSTVNGEQRSERQDYGPSIEPGRRTARGELFRRPPQLPTPQPPISAMSAAPLQAPSHEIALPLGNLLHLAYNPSYTGAEEARGALLRKLAQETKTGGRGRCWSCGSLAIAYDHWNTRSKNFGEVGIAFCEICGVWSVM